MSASSLRSPGFLPVTVIEELEWVLRGVYDLPEAEIVATGASR